MARTLEEILADLNAAEKEYSQKCKKYGIEEKHRKKKEEVLLDENGNPIPQVDENVNQLVQQENIEQVEPIQEEQNDIDKGQ
ncbi:MAG: hypothetical protein Q4E99_06735 [Bacillota bacterium]|nr:hypothetical protein [Bacillota bacterium]